MSTKSFSIRFYAGIARVGGAEVPLAKALKAIHSKQALHSVKRGSDICFLRILETWNNDQNFRGVLSKMRTENIPHKGDVAGNEEEIALSKGQGLVEKTYFIYTHRRSLLIFQQNFHGCVVNVLAEILGNAISATVTFSPILKSDAMARFMSGESSLKKFTVSVARPTNPSMFPNNEFSTPMLSMMNESNAATLSVHMSANKRGTRGNRFPAKMKRAIRDFVANDFTRNVQVEIESDGHVIPIDLLADSVMSKQIVEMRKRYPVQAKMFAALEAARKEVQQDLDAYFGTDEKALT